MAESSDKKLLTLCFLLKDGHILLGMKKRGMGVGKWNGFGGKVEPGEEIIDAAKREVLEEAGLTINNLLHIGTNDFELPGEKQIWQVHIFLAVDYTGTPIETEEMRPQWFPLTEIPYQDMWEDDKYWLPLFLESKHFIGKFVFDEHYEITDFSLNEI